MLLVQHRLVAEGTGKGKKKTGRENRRIAPIEAHTLNASQNSENVYVVARPLGSHRFWMKSSRGLDAEELTDFGERATVAARY